MYYRNAQAAVVVYDVTKSVSGSGVGMSLFLTLKRLTRIILTYRLRSSRPRLGSRSCRGRPTPSECRFFLPSKPLLTHCTPNSIVIALAGNKVDLVRPSSDSDEPTTPTSATSDDDEADDATATPEDDAEGGDEEGTVAASESRRQVSREEAEEYAKECGLLFFETSAKTGEGVVEVFTEIGELVVSRPKTRNRR